MLISFVPYESYGYTALRAEQAKFMCVSSLAQVLLILMNKWLAYYSYS